MKACWGWQHGATAGLDHSENTQADSHIQCYLHYPEKRMVPEESEHNPLSGSAADWSPCLSPMLAPIWPPQWLERTTFPKWNWDGIKTWLIPSSPQEHGLCITFQKQASAEAGDKIIFFSTLSLSTVFGMLSQGPKWPHGVSYTKVGGARDLWGFSLSPPATAWLWQQLMTKSHSSISFRMMPRGCMMLTLFLETSRKLQRLKIKYMITLEIKKKAKIARELR